jgi:fido (protein-threonine AMPylation protein)
MAKPSEKLAQSLEVLHKAQAADGGAAIQARELSRTHRERVVKNGFLQPVIKGWYIPSRPDQARGESTPWYASFWGFCAAYLEKRLGSHWCLSPEQSLSLHAGNWAVPRQLMVRSPSARNKITKLAHGTSVFDLRAALPPTKDRTETEGLRVFSVGSALIESSPSYFLRQATDVRAVLATVRDSSRLLAHLLDGGHTVIAGRLAGAFRNIGRDRTADEIVDTMSAAGFDVREKNPFTDQAPVLIRPRETSPYVNRIRLMWQAMRGPVIENFPEAPGVPHNLEVYTKRVNDAYVTDAYHSLSIEGYRVSRDLIERVRGGGWDPEVDKDDREQRNAMAARGYWLAFQRVRDSITKVLGGDNAGAVVEDDHRVWYRELFAPSVTAGILKASDLAGYRTSQVYIRKSMHVPPNVEAVRDAMPAFFELLGEEDNAAVRIVLGHFIFVYIHPYMDGNGRIGRFLMNVLMASGGYPWTVVPVEERNAYVSSLEKASVGEKIVPFTVFLADLVRKRLAGEPLPSVPKNSS